MRSKRIFLSFLACFVSSAMVTACGQANPAWVQHATDARIAFNAKDTVEADRQAKLVLAEAGNYGGKMPPSANAPWEANILPMQDLGEHLSYAGNLRSLGTDYAMANKWDEAELFYRKALELDSAKYGADSGVVSRYGLPQLIQFLESRGRTKEAGELQEKLAKALEANAAQAPNPNNAFDQSKASQIL